MFRVDNLQGHAVERVEGPYGDRKIRVLQPSLKIGARQHTKRTVHVQPEVASTIKGHGINLPVRQAVFLGQRQGPPILPSNEPIGGGADDRAVSCRQELVDERTIGMLERVDSGVHRRHASGRR